MAGFKTQNKQGNNPSGVSYGEAVRAVDALCKRCTVQSRLKILHLFASVREREREVTQHARTEQTEETVS